MRLFLMTPLVQAASGHLHHSGQQTTDLALVRSMAEASRNLNTLKKPLSFAHHYVVNIDTDGAIHD